jgi:hypothetical protein
LSRIYSDHADWETQFRSDYTDLLDQLRTDQGRQTLIGTEDTREIIPRSGWGWTNWDDPWDTPGTSDTGHLRTARLLWIITTSRELIFSEEYVQSSTGGGNFRMRHSLLANGGPVPAAGEADITVDGGQWQAVLNLRSGGYMPSGDTLPLAKNTFAANGITARARNELW